VDDVGVIGIASEAQATELPRAYIAPQGGLARWKTQEERGRLEREIVAWVQENVSDMPFENSVGMEWDGMDDLG
jgi:4-coumarate--CoA ligase